MRLSKQTQYVIDLLADAGGTPYIVGGTVRDDLLGITDSKDIDIEVFSVTADTIIDAFAARTISVDEVGKSFGVLKVTIDGEDFDISLPRKEIKVSDHHRGFDIHVDIDMTLVEALGRRDFTINALAYDPIRQVLHDPYYGQVDIMAKVLFHTTDAFSEDPLRVLRGLQFAARFDMAVAPKTMTLFQDLKDEFDSLSVERVWGEFEKIFTRGVKPGYALALLNESGWVDHFPALAAINGIQQDARWHPEGDVDVHTQMTADQAAKIAIRDGLSKADRMTLVLSAICHDFGKATTTVCQDDGSITSHGHDTEGVGPSEEFLTSIGAPLYLAPKIGPLVANHMACVNGSPSSRSIRRLMRRLDNDGAGSNIEEWARLVEADSSGRGDKPYTDRWSDWTRLAHDITPGASLTPLPRFLKGEDLMAKGLTPGPIFRKILDASIEAQDDGEIEDHGSAVNWLEGYLENG